MKNNCYLPLSRNPHRNGSDPSTCETKLCHSGKKKQSTRGRRHPKRPAPAPPASGPSLRAQRPREIARRCYNLAAAATSPLQNDRPFVGYSLFLSLLVGYIWTQVVVFFPLLLGYIWKANLGRRGRSLKSKDPLPSSNQVSCFLFLEQMGTLSCTKESGAG